MSMFEKILFDNQIEETANLANEIWHQHFEGIISTEQIDYMLEKFQSFDAIKGQISEGYEYYGIFQNGKEIGYFGICKKDDNSLFLSKLYIKQEYRGKGYASQAFEFIKNIGRQNGNTKLWLTVNVNNAETINIYKHWGMQIAKTQLADIGNGFFMDDYIFDLEF